MRSVHAGRHITGMRRYGRYYFSVVAALSGHARAETVRETIFDVLQQSIPAVGIETTGHRWMTHDKTKR
jgi:hypothetical protein